MSDIVVNTVSLFLRVLSMLIVARAILSWFRPRGYSKLYNDIERALYVLTEPILAPIRSALPPIGPGIDFSPLVALILIDLVQRLLVGFLQRIL